MKTALLSLLVLLLLLGQSSALRCVCGGWNICPSRRETCSSNKNKCGMIRLHSDSSFGMGCMSSAECDLSNSLMTVQCCDHRDSCNRDFY